MLPWIVLFFFDELTIFEYKHSTAHTGIYNHSWCCIWKTIEFKIKKQLHNIFIKWKKKSNKNLYEHFHRNFDV